jgi:NTE family protein
MLRHDLLDDHRPTLLSQILRSHLTDGGDETIDYIESGAHYLTLGPGDTLLTQGAFGDDVYFVLSGRLRAHSGDEVLGEIGRGEPVGELAMFTGEARSASIVALRRTVVARISRQLIEGAIARRPELALKLARRVIERFRRQDDIRTPPTVPITLAILPIAPHIDAVDFARRLRAQQPGTLGRIAVIEPAAGGTRTVEQHGRMIDAIEQDNAAVYLVADGDDTPWTRACLTHADEIILLADAAAEPSPSAVEHRLLGHDAITVARQTLVLLHDADTKSPRGTARWLDCRGRPRHFHIRPKLDTDLARLARIVSGRAVGLVLSGGGARGFAHIGVYQALEAMGVPVDFVGGTSIGALIGTLAALDLRGDEMEAGAREGFLAYPRGNITADFNLLPILSLLKGGRSRDSLARLVERYAGPDIDMEDGWKTFFVVAANFSYGREEVLSTGRLVRNVTASFSIPGVLPPVLLDGSLMFDGATFNNLPVDVMARMQVGNIVGVDVTDDTDRRLDIDAIPNALALLRDRFRPPGKQRFGRVPTVPETMLMSTFITSGSRQREQRRYADLLFRPELPKMGLLDWNWFDQAVAAGRMYATRVLAERTKTL